MIDNWLDYTEQNPSPYAFKIIDVTEKVTPDDTFKAYLGDEILGSYRNLDFLKVQYQYEPEQELREYIKNYVLSSDKNQITKNVRQGDFAEILTSLIVSYFEGLEVPLKKLRWKFNNERSVFCTDLIAHNTGDAILDLYYYEIKSRLSIKRESVAGESNYITVVAHNSLIKDEQAPSEGIADFLARYFYELGDFDSSKKYMDIVKNPQDYNRKFELFLIIEQSRFIPNILTELDNLPPSLNPLRVTVVLIGGLGRLIIETQNLAIEQAVNFIYDK